jgi:hypothetical protein
MPIRVRQALPIFLMTIVAGIQEVTLMALLVLSGIAKEHFVTSLDELLALPWAFACPLIVGKKVN